MRTGCNFIRLSPAAALVVGILVCAATAFGDQGVLSLADGKLKLKAPEGWKQVEPSVKIIDYEFSVPASDGDKTPGRVTVMGAGGTVEANLERWFEQFSQPDGASTKDRAKVEKKTIAGVEVHLVDVSGTYADRRGPFAPAVSRADYRMLAAIVRTQGLGNYFIKFYGPAKTVGENQKTFHALIESLKVE